MNPKWGISSGMDGSLQMISKLGMIKRAGGKGEGRNEARVGLLGSYFHSSVLCWVGGLIILLSAGRSFIVIRDCATGINDG
ncbi:hypothetical protein ASPTUDRAFT_258510 [Aspergillus tubingensis CBS 134.48]|uniref:Uncharacterized protein n=1 Tax=Aspergillus tubingensis (strain CBS 134.48) TaxID=767770 RepID=A0A1L9NN76_ASPTC|nr:hypothetical protein ASPTUDRAFT_258510 [Aspergillus tubingensis CBS 134.48]